LIEHQLPNRGDRVRFARRNVEIDKVEATEFEKCRGGWSSGNNDRSIIGNDVIMNTKANAKPNAETDPCVDQVGDKVSDKVVGQVSEIERLNRFSETIREIDDKGARDWISGNK
jgi:hypothetical protein